MRTLLTALRVGFLARVVSMLSTIRVGVLARILGGRVAAAAAPLSSKAGNAQRTTGIDCSCYYTQNIYVRSPIEGHFTYEGEQAFCQGPHAQLVANLTDSMRSELISNLEAETLRRRSMPSQAAARKARIASEYTRLHPELWTLDAQAWLHPEFVSLVRSAKGEGGKFSPPPRLAEGVYTLPIFSPAFCTLLCEELDHLKASGLPCGQPNSMNRFGALLDELGFSPGLIDPLMRDWMRPLCAALPPLAAVGGAQLDLHRAFVVRYAMGDDESLSSHFDNAEVTLNANLGIDFDAGELLFYGHKDVARDAPIGVHEWSEHPVGHGVLHLGEHVHAALPITRGERLNLVVWMRSTDRRKIAGCPMCGETKNLLEETE